MSPFIYVSSHALDQLRERGQVDVAKAALASAVMRGWAGATEILDYGAKARLVALPRDLGGTVALVKQSRDGPGFTVVTVLSPRLVAYYLKCGVFEVIGPNLQPQPEEAAVVKLEETKAGEVLREKKANGEAAPPVLDPGSVVHWASLYASGLSCKQVAAQCGTNTTKVHAALKAAGVVLRPPGFGGRPPTPEQRRKAVLARRAQAAARKAEREAPVPPAAPPSPPVAGPLADRLITYDLGTANLRQQVPLSGLQAALDALAEAGAVEIRVWRPVALRTRLVVEE